MPSPPPPAPPTTQRLTRDDIVRLGQAGRPWDFLPIVEQALRIAPEDAGLLLLAAANFAKLGLRTPAREKLALIPHQLQADPGVRQLAAVVERLPADEITPEQRIATCAANLAAITPRLAPDAAAEIAAALPAWQARTRDEQWFRADDGNIARRAGGAWTRLADLAGPSRDARLPDGEAPITIDGADPPWLLQRVLRETPRRADGFHRRIRLVEPDLFALMDAFACADLRDDLAHERVRLHLGPRAADLLAADLEAGIGGQISGPILALPLSRPPVAAPVLTAALTRQGELHERLLAEVAAIYDGRDPAWWSQRYAQALDHPTDPDSGGPLRVLLLTHRFSTFIRHSAADLAAALSRLGCDAQVLMEPDDSTLMATVGYLQTIARFRPDLIVLINYTRADLGALMPAGVPVVCWIQDEMPNLFRHEAGSAQTQLDFLVGHLHQRLFTLFGYPRERAFPTPVVACDRKFHPGPVAPDLAERHTCEIAFASNQSETPEACRDRLIQLSAASPASARAIGALYERAKEIAADTMSARLSQRLEAATREELSRIGVPPDEKVVSHALAQWVRPMADRFLRHETARWAAEICEEHGWRFHLYGRGWENHPTLARFARGALRHGEDLRASYQCAAAHLHASVNWLLHQRVMECALSGGLPLCRLKRDDLGPIEALVIGALIDRGTPYATALHNRGSLYAVADSPEALAATALLQRLGLPAPHAWSVLPAWRADPSIYHGGLPPDPETAWFLGDLAETTFTSKDTLAAAVRRAIDRPAWRRNTSASIARRVKARFTYDATARRILQLIRDSLPRIAPSVRTECTLPCSHARDPEKNLRPSPAAAYAT